MRTIVSLIQECYWFLILLALVIRILIAYKFDSIAEMKGHDSDYFGWCFLFGPVGWLMVIALPDLKARYPLQNEQTSISKPDTIAEQKKVQPLESVKTVDKAPGITEPEFKKPEPKIPEPKWPKSSVPDLKWPEPAPVRENENNQEANESHSSGISLPVRILIYIAVFVVICYLGAKYIEGWM